MFLVVFDQKQPILPFFGLFLGFFDWFSLIFGPFRRFGAGMSRIDPENVGKQAFFTKICLFWLCFELFPGFWTLGLSFSVKNGQKPVVFAF